MHRHNHLRPNQPDQLNPLLRIHGDHDERHARPRDRGAAEVDEHEVDVGVALGDFRELGDEEGVAGDVDGEGRVEVIRGGGGGVCGRRRRRRRG